MLGLSVFVIVWGVFHRVDPLFFLFGCCDGARGHFSRFRAFFLEFCHVSIEFPEVFLDVGNAKLDQIVQGHFGVGGFRVDRGGLEVNIVV